MPTSDGGMSFVVTATALATARFLNVKNSCKNGSTPSVY